MQILKPGDRVNHPTLETSGTVLEASDSHAFVAWDAGFRSSLASDMLGPGPASPTAAGWYWFNPDPEHETPIGKLKPGPYVTQVFIDRERLVARFVAAFSEFEVSLLKGRWQRIEKPEWMG